MDPRPARAAVVAALSSIPDARVAAWPAAVDQPTGPTLVCHVAAVRPADVACPYRRTDVDVWVTTQLTTDAVAYDALDDLLAAALSALDSAGLRWTEAQAGVWRDTHPAYRIAVEAYE